MKFLVDIFGMNRLITMIQIDIDVFAKYYFDRNHDNYSQAFISDFILDNFTYHHIKKYF